MKKFKRRKIIYKINTKQLKNGNRNIYITLNIHGLNVPTKRPRLAEWINKTQGSSLKVTEE